MPHGFFIRLLRRALIVAVSFAGLVGARAQTITTPPQSQTAVAGGSVTFTVAATGTGLTYQWRKDGAPVAGATSASLAVANIQPQNAGIYTAVVTSGATSVSASAILGFTATAKVTGAGTEVGADILHPTGNTYDQVLLQGPAAAVTADSGQVTRISYIDLNDDIVQVEFAGPGTLTLLLDNSSGPAAPAKYFQANVSYMKGHASIVIAGATELTNVSVFSVGRANAVNQALFRPDATYDGLADIASIAIVGGNGKFGGLRSANASYFATQGFTGVYAPGIQFGGPIFVGDIDAFDTATPVLLVGSAGDVRITGGDLRQTNTRAVQVSGFTSLDFVNGSTSHGAIFPFQSNRAVLQQNGVDVTTQLVPRPNSSIYFAQLRPGANAESSLASGYAAISFGADGTALINLNISNLSSAQTVAYLYIAGTNDYLLRLPAGQLSEVLWIVSPVGIYTRNHIFKALNEGRVGIVLETANYPEGEVSGGFVTAAGSTLFTPPTSPPTLDARVLTTPNDIDAARFLIQATFGASEAEIAEVRRLGIPEWIKAQKALPASSFLAALREDGTRFPNPLTSLALPEWPRLHFHFNHPVAWLKLVMTAPDQLRQRVAFALSEIFAMAGESQWRVEPFAHFYDILVTEGFGNYRTLIERVSLHPEMAWYLTYLFNQKADPLKGTSPDENYAREVQQLFTVGLVQLQPDGTLLLDSQGRPIPTYDNITITETAKVFTGWAYRNKNDNFYSDPAWDGTPGGASPTAFYSDANGRLQPLKSYEAFHDQTEKRVISLQQLAPRVAAPTIIPAGQTGPADLKMLLDTLFNHPNTGPFISKQLIQRLVTSNPSAAYVYRVARIFANNGSGVRGDLGAVVTAILTDYEARAPQVIANIGYGKIKEPLLRFTSLLRVMKTTAPNGRFADTYYLDPRSPDSFSPFGFLGYHVNITADFGQSVQQAPSVFNFFSTFYSPPGSLTGAGLVAPEMQIVDSNYSIKTPNRLVHYIHQKPAVVANAPVPSPFFRNDLSGLLALSSDKRALIERLNLLLCGGQMTEATKSILFEELEKIPLPTPPPNLGSPPRHAISFVPLNAALLAPKVGAFDPQGPFTIEGWVFKESTASTWIMGKRLLQPSDIFNYYALTVQLSGNVSFNLSTGPGGKAVQANSPGPIPPRAWIHVAGVYDGSMARLYINGVQSSSIAAPNPPAADLLTPFSVGSPIISNGGVLGGAKFDGYMSQVRFWRVARSPAQILQGMTETVPSENTGLVAAWRLDDGEGNTAADSSGNNHPLSSDYDFSRGINWLPLNGLSEDRVLTALHLTAIAPAAALQK